MNKFQVSVIIPVYNAASFVAEAVESALTQPETAEAILIEDGSPDDGLAVCQALAENHEKVRLLRHPGGENRGAAASRNLGMQNARNEYIAFLDADDYYLPGRFSAAREVFASNPGCDGVYEAIGRYIENESGWLRWERAQRPGHTLHIVEDHFTPDQLGVALIRGGYGSFSPNGLVLKSTALEKTGYYDENLRLHEDTDFHIKLALSSKLLPGRLDEPVAIWRIHNNNRISAPRTNSQQGKYRLRQWLATYQWSINHASKEIQELILKRLLFFALISPLTDKSSLSISASILNRIRLLRLIFIYPKIINKAQYWKRFLPGRILDSE